MAKDEKKFRFDKDERVLCFHGPLIYEAKIIKREKRDDPEEPEGVYYLVHYKGWKQTWDEWVPEDRVLKHSDINLQKQQQLKDLHSKRKPSRVSAATSITQQSSDITESRRKRTRDSSLDKTRTEEEVKRPEFKLALSESLKGLLVDDWENVTKNRLILCLPRDPTVSQLLQQYGQEVKDKQKGDHECLEETLQGIKLYFNKTLSSLFYHCEKRQYEEILKEFPDKEPSDVYGAEHLLRLFVEIPSLLSQSYVDSETLVQIKEVLMDLQSFLQEHEKEFFTGDYQTNQNYRER
ncbi:MRG-domain-containing protein [Spinellus fusiger]|nr:MRG-domain-containing protein [Spinellus fusiger]